MSGICYGVSVGPGDCGLITMEAIKVIEKADIIFLPSFPKEECRAYQAVKESYPQIDRKELRCETFTMSRNAAVMSDRHDEIVESVISELDSGKTIAFLTLGEVGIYSTYLYIHDRLLKRGYDSRLIAGVSSVQEIADRLGIALAIGNQEIHIFPNTDKLKERLSLSGTKVFMKPKGEQSAAIEEIRRYVITHEGCFACGISNCGFENEIIAQRAEELDRLQGYFTVIFVSDKNFGKYGYHFNFFGLQ